MKCIELVYIHFNKLNLFIRIGRFVMSDSIHKK